jgi:hypothetical protein
MATSPPTNNQLSLAIRFIPLMQGQGVVAYFSASTDTYRELPLQLAICYWQQGEMAFI